MKAKIYIGAKKYALYIGRKIIPDGYTRLQYIESTTNQYIDTGIKGELGSELTFKGQLTKYNTAQDYGHLWGDMKDTSKAMTFNTPRVSTKTASSRFGDVATSSSTSPVKTIPLNTPVTIIQNKDGATASTGFEVVFNTTTEFTTVNNLHLFTTANDTGVSTVTHKWRCEYYSHKKNGILVQELVPVKRNSDNEVGMYDTVNNQFLTNAGTDKFIGGEL